MYISLTLLALAENRVRASTRDTLIRFETHVTSGVPSKSVKDDTMFYTRIVSPAPISMKMLRMRKSECPAILARNVAVARGVPSERRGLGRSR
jgi:hypothetical protein